MKTDNKRVKFVPFGHPTCKSEALLPAAYARRWASQSLPVYSEN